MSPVPSERIRAINELPVREEGKFVLYWMNAFRRVGWNFSLDRAIERARALQRPLVIFEALRCGYPFASDRLHRFVVEGMAENARRCDSAQVTYFPYLERKAGEGKGLLEALAKEACVVVTDDFPCFFLPRMVAAAGQKLPVLLEAVDSNGLLPMRAGKQTFTTAFSFRIFLQKNLAPHLLARPAARPLSRLQLPVLKHLPSAIRQRWPAVTDQDLADPAGTVAALPIDHTVPAARFRGGMAAGEAQVRAFVAQRLSQYPERRNEPEEEGTSELSPYLHFGHVSVHQVLEDIGSAEDWTAEKLGKSAGGKRNGWWKMSGPAEAFLDELVTWRELGFNFCSRREDYDQYSSLPSWAQVTLAEHANDPRPNLYSFEQLDQARTHDLLWNATQRQLKRDGWFHNYLRMLWGKKILEYSASPEQALSVMVRLMERYSLDGRNPNSFTGFFWVLGRYDRAWGPERKIFGKIRYMSSENTARKIGVKKFLIRYGPERDAQP